MLRGPLIASLWSRTKKRSSRIKSGSIELRRRHAVFAGLSTGAGYLAACWERQLAADATVIVIGADTGTRYVESVFDGHRDAVPFPSLVPRAVTTTGELSVVATFPAWAAGLVGLA